MDFPSGGLEAGSEGHDANLAQGLVKQDHSNPKLILQTGIMQIGDLPGGTIPTLKSQGQINKGANA